MDSEGQSALHHAALYGHEQTLRLLLETGVEESFVNIVDSDFCTALHIAAYSGEPQAVRLLLEARAYKDFPTIEGQTALHFAALGDDEETARVLLEARADTDLVDTNHRTALHQAVAFGKTKIVCLLLQHGANKNLVPEQGRSALHEAVAKGQNESVQLLLEARADTDLVTVDGDSALHQAATCNQHEAVRLLLEAGANTGFRTIARKTFRFSALYSQNPRRWKHNFCNVNPVRMKTLRLRVDTLSPKPPLNPLALKHAHSLNKGLVDWAGQSALHQAAAHGSSAAVQVLLEALEEEGLGFKVEWPVKPETSSRKPQAATPSGNP